MENLHFNLSEEEFSRSRKLLLWIFSGMFFLAGVWVVILNVVIGKKESIPLIIATAPFGISLAVGTIAFLSSVKSKNQFFSIESDKLEFRFGFFRPAKHTLRWSDVAELVLPHKQKKVKFLFNDRSSLTVNLTWLQKKKSSLIRKHLYLAAWEKKIKISKVMYLER